VFLYTLSNYGYDRLGFADSNGKVFRLSPHEALKITRFESDSVGQVRREDHFLQIQKILNDTFENEVGNIEGQLTGVRKRVYEKLRIVLARNDGTLFEASHDVKEAIDRLFKYPLSEYAKQALSRALKDRQEDDLLALVVTLHNEGRLVIEASNNSEDIQIVCSLGYLRK
jgi:hypothetical protein